MLKNIIQYLEEYTVIVHSKMLMFFTLQQHKNLHCDTLIIVFFSYINEFKMTYKKCEFF